jgi:murein DD-endopeptidase MepM/ murein hydrolase activator NlpD
MMKRKFWPVPKSDTRRVPQNGSPGAFWEDRGDRYHCGIDIYAPEGSDVIAVEAGEVFETGVFTSSDKAPHWNRTYYVLVGHQNGFIAKYAELRSVAVRRGQRVEGGQRIGDVGSVLNARRVTAHSPPYVRRLHGNGNGSMLHFELFERSCLALPDYQGGNIFGSLKPSHLVNPTAYLKDIVLG